MTTLHITEVLAKNLTHRMISKDYQKVKDHMTVIMEQFSHLNCHSNLSRSQRERPGQTDVLEKEQ